MFGAELGVGEVKIFGGFEEAEVAGHVGQCFAVAEILEDAGLDGGADGAEEGVGVLLVADVGGGGELGEEAVGGIRLVLGEEAAEGGAGGVEVQAAFGAGFGEVSATSLYSFSVHRLRTYLRSSGERQEKWLFDFCVIMPARVGEGVGHLLTDPNGKRNVYAEGAEDAEKGAG